MKAKLKLFLNYLTSIDRAWLVTWGLIYFSFVTLDIYSHLRYGTANVSVGLNLFGRVFSVPVVTAGTFLGTTILKYTGIALNFVYAYKKFPKDYLLQIALGFTLLADTVLCIDSTSALGVMVFCFAQYFHTARLSGANPSFLLFYTFGMVAVLFLGFLLHIPPIFVISFTYGILLFTNLILAAKWYKIAHKILQKTPHTTELNAAPNSTREAAFSTCCLAGFILFICCDLCVAGSFLASIGFLPGVLFIPLGMICWVFYYPSQLLISNSSTGSRFHLKKIDFLHKNK